MASVLVQVTHGPEAPTRAALGCLIARAAKDAGHDVTLFLVGDGAYLIKNEVIDSLKGVGTGELKESIPALVEANVPIYVSGMSSKARGVDESDLAGKGAAFALPADLVELTVAADKVLTY